MRERSLACHGADIEQVFPNESADVMRFHYNDDYGLVMVRAGAFSNVKAAWKAGFSGKIPSGWVEETVNDVRVYLYNPLDAHQAPVQTVDEAGLPWFEEDDDAALDYDAYYGTGQAYGWQRGS